MFVFHGGFQLLPLTSTLPLLDEEYILWRYVSHIYSHAKFNQG
jgi:hypothetical protein